MEDEGERAPPAYLSEESETEVKRSHAIETSPEHTRISLVDLPDKIDFRLIRRERNGQ
jgi:hypothetical protein